MDDAILIVFIIVLVVLILFKRSEFLDTTAPDYRLGNIIGHWYTENNMGKANESVRALAEPHKGTFANFLIDYKATHLVPNPNKNVFNDNYWWDSMDSYKRLFPHLNISLRNAFKSFNGWDFNESIDPNTCVVHMRVGDFLKDANRTMKVDEIIKATDKLPRKPDVFEVLNGGKLHETNAESKKASEDIINDLVAKLKAKFPNAQVNKIESENADHDFYRMVKAPMLLGGLGSFVTMAAAINENFRLTPGFSIKDGRTNNKEELLYENWFTYV